MRTRKDMPTRPPRPEKVESIEELAAVLKGSNGALLADYRGLTVKTFESLRRALRAQGATCQVVKNTLMRHAAKDLGFGEISEWLEGPTAAIFLGEDIVAPTKALMDFIKANANKPVLKGGYVEGRKLDVASVKSLASLPSREILLANLVGTLQSPMSGLLATLQSPLQSLAATLQSLAAARGAA